MDITTVARIKALLGETGTSIDAVLASMITAMSARFESEMQRPLAALDRTEVYSVGATRRFISLRAAPVVRVDSRGSSVATFQVKVNSVPSFTSVPLLVVNRDYIVEDTMGAVRILADVPTITTGAIGRPIAPYYVQVRYTGGLGVDQPAIEAAYPDLVAAADAQIVYLWRRRLSLGGDQKTGDSAATYDSSYALLPDVYTTLRGYERRAG